jgi:methylated-DNA-protein-cysteine methyltransferase-like protein
LHFCATNLLGLFKSLDKKIINISPRLSGLALSMPNEQSKYQRIWETVKQIPRGKVASYADVASLTGLPGQQRLVGYALHNLPHKSGIPWQRVINAQGRISFPPKTARYRKQKMLLEKEGVVFEKGKVDMENFGVMRWLERM